MDTALAAYLALPAQRTYDLADLALRYLRKELRPEGAGADERPAGEGTQLALDTAGEDETWPDWCLRAQAVGELAVKLGEELAAMEVARLVDDVELPLVPILAKLERTGIAVDLSVLDEIRDRLDSRLADHEARVYQLAGEEFNIGSNPQLQQILFEKLRPAQDQADQDRLHHRPQRAGAAGHHRPPPDPRRADRLPRGGQAEEHLRRHPAQAGRQVRPAASTPSSTS